METWLLITLLVGLLVVFVGCIVALVLMNRKPKNKDKVDDVKIVNDDSITIIVKVIETHRENAYRKVNEELVTMYFEIGKYLSEKVASEKWGAKIIENIATGINRTNPVLKGFDRSSLFRMMQFYETYKDNEIVAPLVRQISWTNILVIFSF